MGKSLHTPVPAPVGLLPLGFLGPKIPGMLA